MDGLIIFYLIKIIFIGLFLFRLVLYIIYIYIYIYVYRVRLEGVNGEGWDIGIIGLFRVYLFIEFSVF